MPAFLTDKVFLLIAGIAAIWFFLRFVMGPKRGAPSLAGMFTREKPVATKGIGAEAIATLVADTKHFFVGRSDARGLILAGPFAAAAGRSTSTVTFVVICDDPSAFSGTGWCEGWSYPGRDHQIMNHQEEVAGAARALRLTLRGSPPLHFHFIGIDALDPPASLREALAAGAITLDDPTGIAAKLRRHWHDLAGQNRGEKT